MIECPLLRVCLLPNVEEEGEGRGEGSRGRRAVLVMFSKPEKSRVERSLSEVEKPFRGEESQSGGS